MTEQRQDVEAELRLVVVHRARRAASAWIGLVRADAQVCEVIARQFLERKPCGGRAVRLAAVVIDLKRTELVDGIRLCRGGEPVAAHLAAESERGVVHGRAVGQGPLVETGNAAVARVYG